MVGTKPGLTILWRSCFRPDAGRTKHQAGPTTLSLSHSLRFPSRRTHRHLPKAAAGAWPPPLPSQVLSKALEHPQGHQTGFSFEAERKEGGEKMGGPVVLSHRLGPHMYSCLLPDGPPRDHLLPAPCSPRTCNSSRKVDSLSLKTREGGGRARRQVLACQEGPGPTSTKTGTIYKAC